MKSKKTIGIVYYICSIFLYISAVICFFGDGTKAMGIMWLGLGATYLILGATFINKNKENDSTSDNSMKE